MGTVGGDGVVGFPPGLVFAGSIHQGDPAVLDAQFDASTAYKRLMHMQSFPIATATEGKLDGLELSPGVYASWAVRPT